MLYVHFLRDFFHRTQWDAIRLFSHTLFGIDFIIIGFAVAGLDLYFWTTFFGIDLIRFDGYLWL